MEGAKGREIAAEMGDGDGYSGEPDIPGRETVAATIFVDIGKWVAGRIF